MQEEYLITIININMSKVVLVLSSAVQFLNAGNNQRTLSLDLQQLLSLATCIGRSNKSSWEHVESQIAASNFRDMEVFVGQSHEMDFLEMHFSQKQAPKCITSIISHEQQQRFIA